MQNRGTTIKSDEISKKLKVAEIEIIFYYEVKDGQFISDEPLTKLFKDKKEQPNTKKEQLQTILNNVPDILYYDDFCYDVPKDIKFTGEDNSLNTMWKAILSDAFLSFKKDKQKNKTDLTFEGFINNFLEDDKKDNALNTLSQLSTYISHQIQEPWNKKINLAQTVSFKEVRLEYLNINNAICFEFKVISENGSNFAVNERSKGFKWFFSFVMLTTFRMSRNANTLFLLDEPASNLHASVQEEITQLIIELTNQCQVIYTTHSPYMLDPLYIRNVFLMINEGESDFTPPTIRMYKAQNWISNSKRDLHMRPILDFLYFSYPRIVPNNDSVFVEGYGDYLHLTFWTLLVKSNDAPSLNFIPFTGAGTMRTHINYLKTQNYKVKILLDDDKNGQDAKQNYIDEFCLDKKDILLHTDINKGVKLIEDFYTAKDKDNIFKVNTIKNQQKNEKDKLKTAVCEILKNPEILQKIELEEETKNKIKKIFEALR
jgi:predicted ATP-dependent endonuclease of OLD family